LKSRWTHTVSNFIFSYHYWCHGTFHTFFLSGLDLSVDLELPFFFSKFLEDSLL